MAVLGSNLMMYGCRLVRKKAAEFLDQEMNVVEVTVDYGDIHPDAEVSRSGEGESSATTLKCTFKASVFYGFADRVDVDEVLLVKFISKRWLAGLGSGASTMGGEN